MGHQEAWGLGPPAASWERHARRPRSRFGSPPGFTLHRFSPHFKGSIFVQPREECKLASCFQSRALNPERAVGACWGRGERSHARAACTEPRLLTPNSQAAPLPPSASAQTARDKSPPAGGSEAPAASASVATPTNRTGLSLTPSPSLSRRGAEGLKSQHRETCPPKSDPFRPGGRGRARPQQHPSS